MSENFNRVKRDILSELNYGNMTQDSWAKTMLKHTAYLQSIEDQHDFWNWMSNPKDIRDFPKATFAKSNTSKTVSIPTIERIIVTDKDDEKECQTEIVLKNKIYQNGTSVTIITEPVEEKSCQ